MDNEADPETIMIVDDTPANLKLLTEMLQGQGCRVLALPDGAKALAAAARRPPDLILLDITMPEMDGFEVCGRLKADPALRDIPVIFISALTETADKVKAFSTGGVDYVTKPFQFEEVHARVRTHLRLRALQLELNRQNQHLERLVQDKVAEISDSQLATIVALANLAESRDETTGAHIERTQALCRLLATALRADPRYASSMTDAFIESIHHAAPLHDVGKVGISDSILLKPGRLTEAEFESMKTHATIGADTLQSARKKYPRNFLLNMGIAIARSHHERWDGTGYPDGLAGEDIPLSARVMAVADVYDALRSIRPYKEPFTHMEAVKAIEDGAGTHFDPALVGAFRVVAERFDEVFQGMPNGR